MDEVIPAGDVKEIIKEIIMETIIFILFFLAFLFYLIGAVYLFFVGETEKGIKICTYLFTFSLLFIAIAGLLLIWYAFIVKIQTSKEILNDSVSTAIVFVDSWSASMDESESTRT